jgi:hypothetical protein
MTRLQNDMRRRLATLSINTKACQAYWNARSGKIENAINVSAELSLARAHLRSAMQTLGALR